MLTENHPPKVTTKVILVTGGAKRIGSAIVQAFHNVGYYVIIHYQHSHAEAVALAKLCNHTRPHSAKILQANLANMPELENLAKNAIACFGRIDVVVHNASRFYPTPFGEITPEDWDNLIFSNSKAPLFLTQFLLPTLQQNHGCVLSILDIHANGKPFQGYTVYNMAKSAHQMMVQSLALELAPQIRVNGIAPGVNILPEPNSEQAIDIQTLHDISQSIPLQRYGTPDDIAQTAVFLATAPYITGQIVAVDGGRSLTLKGG